jgi:hypothetical protein
MVMMPMMMVMPGVAVIVAAVVMGIVSVRLAQGQLLVERWYAQASDQPAA